MGQAGYLHLFETGCRWLPGRPWPRSQQQVFRLTREKIHLPAEVRTSRQFSGKVEYVTTFAEPKIEPDIPAVFTLNEAVRSSQRRPVPYILSSPVSGSKPQPGEQVNQRNLPELFYLHPASIQINRNPAPHCNWQRSRLPPHRKRSRTEAVKAIRSLR